MEIDLKEVETHASFAFTTSFSAIHTIGHSFITLEMPLTTCEAPCSYSPPFNLSGV